MELFLEKMNEKMNDLKEEFMKQITTLSTNIAYTIEEKLSPLVEENLKLKNEVTMLKTKVRNMERELRHNNIILHGIEECETSTADLLEIVLKTFNSVTTEGNIESFDKWEISNIYRLGKKEEKKQRPILVKLTLAWRKLEILRNNKKFPSNIYVTEDFPKDVLEIRKELKLKQMEEIKNGNFAVIRYDKIIIKQKSRQDKGNEKRKRSHSKTPPQLNCQEKTRQGAPNKINKTNAFEYMSRPRSNPQPQVLTTHQ